MRQPFYSAGATVADADQTDTDIVVDGLGGEAQHALLVGRPGRRVIDDLVVFDGVPVFRGLGAGERNEKRSCREQEFFHIA